MQLETLEINQKLLLIHRRKLRCYFIVLPICNVWDELQIDFWIRDVRRRKNNVWRCAPLRKHINHLVVECAPAIFLGNLVSLIDEKVFDRDILHQNQQVEQAFWGHGKDKVMFFFQGHCAR